MVRSLMETGVIIRLARPTAESLIIAPEPRLMDVITQIAEGEEAIDRGSLPQLRRTGGSKNPLSRHQLDYARRMHAAGETLRTIGMLFQLAPNEVWQLLNDETPEEVSEADHEPDEDPPAGALPDSGMLRLIPSHR